MMSFSRFISALPLSLLAILVSAGLGGPPAAHAQHPTAVTSIINSAQDTTLEVNHNGSLLMPGTRINNGTENDSIPAEGAGTRLLWYPAKAAFRAGRVFGSESDGWDADSIGAYSVAFGVNTRASGFTATAMGSNTTASGYRATAMGTGTTASGNDATAMGRSTTASGGDATAMGNSTTARTTRSLSIGRYNSANTTYDNSLFVVGNGNPRVRSDALVLKENGDLAVGHSIPDARLHAENDADGALSNPTVRAENLSTGSGIAGYFLTHGSDATMVLANRDGNGQLLKGFGSNGGNREFEILNDGSMDFYSGSNRTVNIDAPNGDINIDGSFNNSGADFAEELTVEPGALVPEPADLVGVRGGHISLDTDEADRVMIASTSPALTGNATTEATGDARRVAVAFVGQVPVKVRGLAKVGDLIVSSGKNDGTALAVAPAEYRRSTHGPIAGQAWSDKSTDGVGEVTVAVGLGRSGAVAERLRKQRRRIDGLEERLTALENRPSSVPGAGGHARGAGLPGSWLWGGALLLFLLGGSLATLLQRTGQ